MKDFSFIIPAYNAGKTINTAIESIKEKVPNAEIIVVENGSTDDTSDMVERSCEKNENVQLLHSEKGVSAARNMGIKHATGKWIIFVDADDRWVGEERNLKDLTTSPSDICFCSYLKGHGEVVFDFPSEDVKKIRFWLMSKPTQRMTIWAKIYRRTFLVENELFFNTTLRVSEDSEFLVRCLRVCKKAFVAPIIIYNNQLDGTSVTRTVDQSRITGHLDAMRLVERESPQDEALMQYVLAHINLIAVHDIFNCEIRCGWGERVKQIKSLINEDVMKRQLEKLRFSSNLQMLPPFLFKSRMYTLGGLICYMRSMSNRMAYKKSRPGGEAYEENSCIRHDGESRGSGELPG